MCKKTKGYVSIHVHPNPTPAMFAPHDLLYSHPLPGGYIAHLVRPERIFLDGIMASGSPILMLADYGAAVDLPVHLASEQAASPATLPAAYLNRSDVEAWINALHAARDEMDIESLTNPSRRSSLT
ncbi:MAG: hypothetical protein RhofKO_34700 [Rhodothermales bacterium]